MILSLLIKKKNFCYFVVSRYDTVPLRDKKKSVKINKCRGTRCDTIPYTRVERKKKKKKRSIDMIREEKKEREKKTILNMVIR